MVGLPPSTHIQSNQVLHDSSKLTLKRHALAGHRKSELGASLVFFPWNVRTGFAFHRLHTPGMRPLHPERSTEKILRGSPIPLFRWPARALGILTPEYGELCV